MLSLLATLAHASCSLRQEAVEGGVAIEVGAGPGAIHCRTVTLTSTAPLLVEGRIHTREDRRVRLKDENLAARPGGGWTIGAPQLREGDTLEIRATTTGDVTVALDGLPPPVPRGTWIDEVRTFHMSQAHPAWGFADARRARTIVEWNVRVDPDAPPQLLPLPPDATVDDAGGLPILPGALSAAPGVAASVRWSVPGAVPNGVLDLPPGSFLLQCPACDGIGVDERVELPAGGTVRWRVTGTDDGDRVIPDADTWLAGLAWRFARVSLPEPAVPVRLKGLKEPREILRALYDEVQALVDASLPTRDALSPRQLNRAWRSGWVTPVERALVLHRMLLQEKIPARWYPVGEHSDVTTLTGYDALLLQADVAGETLWLDPTCAICAPGELSARWMGRATVGGGEVPRAPGRLVRRTVPSKDGFEVTVEASGSAVRWLREAIVDTDPEHVAGRLATRLGVRGATLAPVAELTDPVTLHLVAPSLPHDPFEGGPVPFAGGFEDVVAGSPPAPGG